MNNDELHIDLVEAVGDIEAATCHIRERANQLLVRLTTAESEALQAGGVNDGWAHEVDRLTHLLDQTSNYIADDAVRPSVVQFNNGRTVKIITDADGPHLDVSFVPSNKIKQPPLTQTEQEALDRLKNSGFIHDLLSGKIERELEAE